jgi:RecB family exonuclease
VDKSTEEGYQRRIATQLDNFWQGEVSSLGQALVEEQPFELTLDPEDGSAPVVIFGKIDRIDRLPSGGIEVIDYKTGSAKGQKYVDDSLQLTIYALACRDALDLGTPERVTLYFTESALRLSTTRTDEQLDLARADVLARVSRMRAGEFAATPGDPCRWCDYRAMCPERAW